LDAGTLKLQRRHFHLKPLIEEISVGFQEPASAKQLTFNVDVGDHVVHTDPMLLQRIVQNLVENAFRYTPTGGITITTRLVDNKVSLSVADTGIGISIVHRICSLLNMSLRVESDLGKGSVFTVGIEPGDSAQVVQQDVGNGVFPPILDNMFVLVIDDEEDIRFSMEGVLEVWGCTVMVAESGKEAVQQLIEYGSCPDAVITDFRLKDNETGTQALELISKHCQTRVPAIIITGDIAPDRLLEIDKLDLPVLHKPCNADQLQHYLHSI